MNFDSVVSNPNAWKGSGTVSGVHTHTAPIVVTTLVSNDNSESTLEVLNDTVVIEKDLLVKGTLTAPGFTPGHGSDYPANPTFGQVQITHSIENLGVTTTNGLVSMGPATVNGVFQAETIKLNDINIHDGVVKTKMIESDNATVTGTMYAQNVYAADGIQVNGEVEMETAKVTTEILAQKGTFVDIHANNAEATNLMADTLSSRTTGLLEVTDETKFKENVTFEKKITSRDAEFTQVDTDLGTSKSWQTDNLAGLTGNITIDNALFMNDKLNMNNYDITNAGIGDFTTLHVHDGTAQTWSVGALKSVSASGTITVTDNTIFTEDLVAQKKVIAQDLIGNNMVSGDNLAATVEISAPQITGDQVSAENITATQNVLIEGNLTVNGQANIPVTIPSHINATKITLNEDFNTGHQKVELTSNKIILEDTTLTDLGQITLDAATGKITLNGGILCHNQYASTASPSGVVCDFVDTLNVASDTITGHRSDFGRNVAGESIYATGSIESQELKTNKIYSGSTLQATGNWDFSGASVSGLPHNGGGGETYPSITEYEDHVDVSKRLTVSHIGWDNPNKVNFQGNIDFTQAIVTGMPDHTPGITEYVDHIEVTKNLRAEAGFRLAHLEPLEDSIMVSGQIDFANATVTGLPGGTTYPSITEEEDKVTITKPVHAPQLITTEGIKTTVIKVDQLEAADEDIIEVVGPIDFSGATVSGFSTSYPSITEEPNYIKIDKALGVNEKTKITLFEDDQNQLPDALTFTVNDAQALQLYENEITTTLPVRALNFGYVDAGIEFDTSQFKRFDVKLDDSLAFSVAGQQDGSTRTIDYSTETLINRLYATSIHARPPNAQITMSNNVVFEQGVEFKNHIDIDNATLTGFTVAAGQRIRFIPQPNNTVGVGTMIDDMQVETQFIGMPNATIQFITSQPQMIALKILGTNILSISNLLVDCARPFHTVSSSSNGNFTACHLTEGNQADIFEPGCVVTSTGEFCVRDQSGVLIPHPKDTPSTAHAVCKVRHAAKGDHALGIVITNEVVASNVVNHDSGGVTIRSPVQEQDGHKMVAR